MVTLRELEEADLEKVRAWRNRPEVRANMFTDHEISRVEHVRWFETIRDDPSRVNWIVRSDHQDCGAAYLYDLDGRQGRCYWGFYLVAIAEQAPRIGTVLEYLVAKHVFDELKLRKLCGEVLAVNNAVVRMHERFGFRREGLLRQHIVKRGVPHDVVCLSMLADEWRQRKPALEAALHRLGLL